MLRCLNRNKQTIWFAKYNGRVEDVNEQGLFTGDDHIDYSEPVETRVNVSPAGGDANTQLFGTDLRYDKTLTYDAFNAAVEINEYSILWVDSEPYIDGILQPHDYIVKQIATSHDKTSFAVAIERTNKNEQSN